MRVRKEERGIYLTTFCVFFKLHGFNSIMKRKSYIMYQNYIFKSSEYNHCTGNSVSIHEGIRPCDAKRGKKHVAIWCVSGKPISILSPLPIQYCPNSGWASQHKHIHTLYTIVYTAVHGEN